MDRRAVVVSLALSLSLLTGSAQAANRYTVYGCGTPEAGTGPVAGWTMTIQGAFVGGGSGIDCSGSGLMFASTGYAREPFPPSYAFANGDGATFTLDAPAGMRITRLLTDAHVSVDGREAPGPRDFFYQLYALDGQGSGASGTFLEACKGDPNWGCLNGPAVFGPVDHRAVQQFTPLDAARVQAHLRCYNADPSWCTARKEDAVFAILERTEVDLAESPSAAPTAAAVTGSLVADPVLQGEETLLFDAADRGNGDSPGAGVYRVVVEAGGVSVPAALPGVPDSCADARPGNADPFEFTALLPCPASGGFRVPVDTSKLPEGTHELVARLQDAAGNERVLAARTVRIDNRPSPDDAPGLLPPDNGAGATRSARLALAGSGRARRLRFGARTTARVHLRDAAGAPIAGATLQLLERPITRAAFTLAPRTVRTDPQGAATIRIPAGASRTFRIAYRANLADPEPVAVADLALSVPGATTFAVRRSGRLLTLGGRVRARPLPRGGVLIDVQGRVGRSWQTFATARARGAGRWRTRYRLRSSSSRVRLRVRVRRDSGWPYALYVSRSRRA